MISSQYVNIPLSEPTPGFFTCTTYAINLAEVCNPANSYYSPDPAWSWNGNCKCFTGSNCPPYDLTGATPLLFSVQLRLYQYDLSSGCGNLVTPSASPNYVTMGTYSSNSGFLVNYNNPPTCAGTMCVRGRSSSGSSGSCMCWHQVRAWQEQQRL